MISVPFSFRKNKNGFTLAETLIVVSLLIVLAFIGLTANVTNSFKSARDSKRKQDLNKLVRYMEDYYNDHGRYPPGDATGLIAGIPWGQELAPYNSVLPQDPLAPTRNYFYQTDANQQNFFVFYTILENTADPDVTRSGCTGGCGPSQAYNYVVHSSNILLAGGLPIEPGPTGGSGGEGEGGGGGGGGGGGAATPSPTAGPTVTLGPSPTPQPTPTEAPPPGAGCSFAQCGVCGKCGGIQDCGYLSKCWFDAYNGWYCRFDIGCMF
jgi:type II secretory pathway pseudopilin PulG